MKFEELLNEGISDIVYHGTDPGSVYSILKSNMFRLTPDVLGVEAMMNKKEGGPYFFMSTARSKHADYIKDLYWVFTLDGRRLRQNHTGKPLDFFGGRADDEMEDRIYTKRPYIDNATRYIMKVEFTPFYGTNKLVSAERKVIELCDQLRLPLFVYENKRDLQFGRNPMSREALQQIVNADLPGEDIVDRISSERKLRANSQLAAIIRLYRDELNSSDVDVLRKITDGYKIKSSLHLANNAIRQELIKIMRDHRFRTSDQLYDDIERRMRSIR